MKKSINLLRQTFESSSGTTPQWKQFASQFKRDLKKELEATFSLVDFKFSRGHFYCSCFFKVSALTEDDKGYRCFHLFQSDVRWFHKNKVIVREVKDFEDYTGGRNHEFELKPGFLRGLLDKIKA